jgi:hypothetical protein
MDIYLTSLQVGGRVTVHLPEGVYVTLELTKGSRVPLVRAHLRDEDIDWLASWV